MSTAAARHRVEFPDITIAMREARIHVATARLGAFQAQCYYLASIIYGDPVRHREIVDFLYDLALANGLVRVEGEERIQDMILAGLRGEA